MTTCLTVAADNTLQLDPIADPSSCNYLVNNTADVLALSNVNTLFDTYLAFDPAVFAEVTTSMIVAFVFGFNLGKVLAGLRKL